MQILLLNATNLGILLTKLYTATSSTNVWQIYLLMTHQWLDTNQGYL